ncbi:MAG: hypothetical protein ACE5OR_05330, partial [bacterium]
MLCRLSYVGSSSPFQLLLRQWSHRDGGLTEMVASDKRRPIDLSTGAGNGIRTRDPQLGRLM